jgi:hypothetical protein
MKYNYLSFIFSSIFIRIFSQEYCKYGVSCLSGCTQCGNNNVFSDCNYVNLFCGNINNDIKFISSYQSRYINYFSQNSALSNICGRNKIEIGKKEKKQNIEILKINKDNTQSFLTTQKMNCYYEFENTYFKDTSKNISLIFEHSGNSNDNILDFFIIIMLYPKSNSPHIFDLTKNNFKNTKETIDLKHYTSFSLFIDVGSNANIKESVSISLNYIDKKKLSPIIILLIILGGLIFIILVILIISIIKSKLKKNQRTGNRNSIRNNRNSVQLTQEELEKMEKMKKIKQLFENELVPLYYSKERDDKEYDGCPICLKKFRDNISKISILPCNHIFHYKCLYDWLINNHHWKCPICNLDLTENVKLVARSNKASKDQINIINFNQAMPTISSNEIISLNLNTNN